MNVEQEQKQSKKKASKSVVLNRTPFINESTADRKWYVIDAKGQRLGRLACEIVRILRGKRKATFTPHCDNGDFVVVINADKIEFTGKRKGEQTIYRRHSGYPGGLKEETLDQLMSKNPSRAIKNVVSRMLPKSVNLRTRLLKKLKVYAGEVHPHSAQKPVLLEEIPNV